MDAVEFLEKWGQMCDNITFCECCDLKKPPLEGCKEYVQKNPREAIETVDRYIKEHIAKTRQSEFLKMFPDADLTNRGVINILPCKIEAKIKQYPVCVKSCDECRYNYWFTEVE